ncbi:MAG TPA: universal stress protein, partial [Candidatus Sulfomarinibacteraceae bacterium]|nr:universal stress protein [Candidatus Sulfomarinibacteraceae bacterium]
MKQILIAVDQDLLAEQVIRHGNQLAQALGATVTVCHVMPEEHYRRVEEQQIRENQSYPIAWAEAEARDVVEAALKRVSTTGLDINILGAVGEPAETIVEI